MVAATITRVTASSAAMMPRIQRERLANHGARGCAGMLGWPSGAGVAGLASLAGTASPGVPAGCSGSTRATSAGCPVSLPTVAWSSLTSLVSSHRALKSPGVCGSAVVSSVTLSGMRSVSSAHPCKDHRVLSIAWIAPESHDVAPAALRKATDAWRCRVVQAPVQSGPGSRRVTFDHTPPRS